MPIIDHTLLGLHICLFGSSNRIPTLNHGNDELKTKFSQPEKSLQENIHSKTLKDLKGWKKNFYLEPKRNIQRFTKIFEDL
ncbi:373_t:CDS:2 [Dentiscutata erythropus]|uniref:373_t:CDS:1 n=1 Tax=Dentiscutata erythropus TaxID=1348616 RepID=A0A9N9E6V6_9GLOM|nr:373_t:CDS:2 [Dentiscutata erythropus]